MTSTTTLLTRTIALVALLLGTPTLAHALVKGPIKPTLTIDCGDPANTTACLECCDYPTTCGPNVNTCCPYNDPKQCPVVNKPQPTKLTISIGGADISFESVAGDDGDGPHVRVALETKFATLLRQTTDVTSFRVKTRLRGTDAGDASLLYPIAVLGFGADAITKLQGLGYDVAADGPSASCADLFGEVKCTAIARQLSQTIAGSLELGDPARRDAFLDGVQALGFAPCQIIP